MKLTTSALPAATFGIFVLPAHSFYASNLSTTFAYTVSLSNPRPSITGLCMKGEQSDEVDSSRRSALHQLTAIVSTAITLPRNAIADEEVEVFGEESDDNEEFLFDEQDEDENQFATKNTNLAAVYAPDSTGLIDPWDRFTPRIMPTDDSALSQAFADKSNPSSTGRKKSSSVTKTAVASTSSKEVELSTDHMDSGSIFALSFPLMVLGGAAYSFSKEKSLSDTHHTGTGSPKVKLVMVENEPYGLDKGRKYYRGVDITINDPIPESDIRRYCDASLPMVTNECAQSIAGYLEDVSLGGNSRQDSDPTASAIINYLDSLSTANIGFGSQQGSHQATGVAFSTYIQGLSEGSIPTPASAESVAVYLDALASKERERVSKLEARVNELETSMDDKVARELNKIVKFLVDRTGIGFDEYNEGNRPGGWSANGSIYRGQQVNGSGGWSDNGLAGNRQQQVPTNLPHP
jgi:hypothetical protein